MHQRRRIVGPGSLMELLDSLGIANGVTQLILCLIKDILISLLVCRKVLLQFFDNLGTDGIPGRGIERPGGICEMQQ